MALTTARTLGLVTAVFGTGFGVLAVASPAQAAIRHGVPVPASSIDAVTTTAWVRMFGGRNLVVGAGMLAAWLRGDDRGLATLMMCISIGGAADGAVMQAEGARAKAVSHYVGGGLIAAVGLWLWTLASES